jgi:hypothetical protein
MSRLTGSDALELMEAYQEVYKPKELSVDEVWEEVENWVNSLLEEGYDLSEYTWEDMYESYLIEANPVTIGPGGFNVGGRPVNTVLSPIFQTRPGVTIGPGGLNVGGRPVSGRVNPVTIGPGGFNVGNRPVNTVLSPIFQTRPGVTIGPGGFNVGGRPVNTTQPPQEKSDGSNTSGRSSAPIGNRTFTPNRPSGTSTSRPTVPATATTSATPTATATPTRSSVQSGIEDLRRMGAASLMRQQGRTMPDGSIPTGSSLEPRPAVASAPVPSAPVATVRPVPTTQTRRTSAPTRAPILLQRQSFDPFDVIMGHLLDEGYAETLEAAEAIMANMSEEWIQDIVEVTGGGHISMDDTKYTDKLSPAQKRFHQFGPKSTKLVPGSREQHPRRNSWGGSRSPAGTESGLSMTPRERAELAAKRAERKGQGKRASKIRRIINPPTDWSGN